MFNAPIQGLAVGIL